MKTIYFDVIKKILTADPFTFLDGEGSPITMVGGYRPKNPRRAAQFYHFLSNTFTTMTGTKLADDVIKACVVTVDNETGWRTTRESGYAFSPGRSAYLIRYHEYLAGRKDLGNGPSMGKDATMETDYVKYRGGGWIQLTGAANYKKTGQIALNMRMKLTTVNPLMVKAYMKYPNIMDMPSVMLDLLCVDPLWCLFCLIIKMSKTGSKYHLDISDRVMALNDSTAKQIFLTIGYDDNIKPPRFKHVPSLTTMLSRVNNFSINKTNKDNYEKNEMHTRNGTQNSRRFKSTRSSWS